MDKLPHNLYRAARVRELDRMAIEEHGIPGATLMARAGEATFQLLHEGWPDARRIAVLCGVGNNGGDGFVIARLAHEAGLDVTVYQLGDAAALKNDALAAAQAMADAGITSQSFNGQPLQGYDVVVDALLGIGLDRDVEAEWAAAIDAINQSGAGVLAVDIPSGLHADSGRVLGTAVHAHLTISFIGLKQGMFTAQGPDCCGEIVFSDLDVPAAVYTYIPAASLRLNDNALSALLMPRSRAAHKGHYGHVLIIGGNHGMSGAARMAGEAAGRSGAGLVSVATRAAHAAMISSARPELMAHATETVEELHTLIDKATVIAIGPGLGRDQWAQTMLGAVLESRLPMVVDADALHLIAAEPFRRDNWVLTPHPGEAAHLLGGVTTAAIQADRFKAVDQLQQQYGGVVVLKGSGTLICGKDNPIYICNSGNPGMASGGMGDVLTGVIASLLAQGLKIDEAAQLGVSLHARAGDRAAIAGERGLLATDLMTHLHHLVNPSLP